jgi:Trk K+ transport system NAD-binding subunit
MSLANLKIESGSLLINLTVSEIEQMYDLSVVFMRRNSLSDFHPPADCCLSAQDVLVVLGGPNQIRSLASDNYPTS